MLKWSIKSKPSCYKITLRKKLILKTTLNLFRWFKCIEKSTIIIYKISIDSWMELSKRLSNFDQQIFQFISSIKLRLEFKKIKSEFIRTTSKNSKKNIRK